MSLCADCQKNLDRALENRMRQLRGPWFPCETCFPEIVKFCAPAGDPAKWDWQKVIVDGATLI